MSRVSVWTVIFGSSAMRGERLPLRAMGLGMDFSLGSGTPVTSGRRGSLAPIVPRNSFRRNPRVLGDPAPSGKLGRGVSRKLFGRAGQRPDAENSELVLHVRPRKVRADGVVELVDRRARGAGARNDREPPG